MTTTITYEKAHTEVRLEAEDSDPVAVIMEQEGGGQITIVVGRDMIVLFDSDLIGDDSGHEVNSISIDRLRHLRDKHQ